MKDGFIKVAAASPMIKVADTDYNAGGFDSKVNDCVSMPGQVCYPVKLPCEQITGADNYAFAA